MTADTTRRMDGRFGHPGGTGEGRKSMASVNFTGSKDTGRGGKLKTAAEVKAQMRHCDTEERLSHDHANENINKAETPNNYTIRGKRYVGATRSYERRIAEIDSAKDSNGDPINRNHRKDRVTCFCLEVPCPDAVPKDKRREWFKNVADIMRAQYGRNNFIEGYVHVDEIHDYYDPAKGEVVQSLEHMHAFIVPEHEGKLNGKWFSSLANINSLNTAIEGMTVREYGCQFQTGEKKKGKSVERLKEQSTKALEQAIADTSAHEIRLQEQEADLQARRDDLEREREKYAAEAEKAIERANTAYEECKAVSDRSKEQFETFMGFLGGMHPKRKDGTPIDLQANFIRYARKQGVQIDQGVEPPHKQVQDANTAVAQVRSRKLPNMPERTPDSGNDFQMQ